MNGNPESQNPKQQANKLGSSRSPYLKQHQHNPVDWYPWSDDALSKAKAEQKLIVVSIGYSACHWCHVMERESFEDQEVADVMNEHFVSIKVDREEHPDIDQIYMTAVQLMSGRGGWPLNCICLPDGRPIHGGTYFPREAWTNVLLQLKELWKNKPHTVLDYAEKLASGIAQSERLPVFEGIPTFEAEQLRQIILPWKEKFDLKWGGLKKSPKFPMPDNWNFLLQYGFVHQDSEVLEQVHNTLQKMASGGIYDHIGGGFARYSVDERWHIPHFEKMLYDNAQLVSVYLQAWLHDPLPIYRRTVVETLAWCKREMKSINGGYYCALDADSEGVEGKFYTFYPEEFDQVLDHDEAEVLKSHFHLTEEGNWAEEETNVLYTNPALELESDLEIFIGEAKEKLLHYRNQRIKPGLDDKQLCSWNAMMLKAYARAYNILSNPEYLEEAKGISKFIGEELEQKDGSLLRQPQYETHQIPGYLEDYAHYASALLELYRATLDEKHLWKAKKITDYVLANFLDEDRTFLYFTHRDSPVLIARKQETLDNVIPSSNSVMMHVLDELGIIFDESEYENIVTKALSSIAPYMSKYGSAYSNWAALLLKRVHGNKEIILSGSQSLEWKKDLMLRYDPLTLVFGGTGTSEIPILKARTGAENLAYVCQNKTCSLPLKSREELVHLLN